MKKSPKNWKVFFLKMVLPTMLTITLFIISFFYFLVPSMEENLKQEKRVMIKELTQVAWSIIDEYAQEEKEGVISKEQAQKKALSRIKEMRYGKDNKDYFWIFDTTPRMVMHPYRDDLNGQDLSKLIDRRGERIFVIFSDIVKAQGAGYHSYMWQFNDNKNKVVPKLSYVKGHEHWGWIIGTGIYIEDIKTEISKLTKRVIITSIIIILITLVLLIYIISQSINIEKQRVDAELSIIESKNKYKALIEASTDGFIMIFDKSEMICNPTLAKMLGYDEKMFGKLKFENIIPKDEKNETRKNIENLINDEDVKEQFEGELINHQGEAIDVVLACSKISLSGRDAHILIARNISESLKNEKRLLEKERENTIAELQSALLFLNQTISNFATNIVSCRPDTSIEKAAIIMSQKGCGAILISSETNSYIGIVTDHDIREKACSKEISFEEPVSVIMNSPIITISEKALVFEAVILMKKHNIRHLALEKENGKIDKIITNSELLKIQDSSSISLIESIKKSNSIDEIESRHANIPFLVTAILNSGGKSENLARVIARIADTIVSKLVSFAIDEIGPPPVKFSFLTMGSEGRDEQTLNTDQDNAILYEDPPEGKEEETKEYFMKLATMVCTWLDQVGYDFCDGDIMAMNPKWCQSISEWEKTYYEWIYNGTPQDLLEVQIFFDFKSVYGDEEMPEILRKKIFQYVESYPPFMIFFVKDALNYKPPLSLFGNIITESSGDHLKTFNIKATMRTIINFARIYALKYKTPLCNTFDRLKYLNDNGFLSDEIYIDISNAYDFLMYIRLKHQAISSINKTSVDNHIDPEKLTQIERLTIKKIFSQINIFQQKLAMDFKGARDDIA